MLEAKKMGRIVAVHKERHKVLTDAGIYGAKLKASIYHYENSEEFPLVGDMVQIAQVPDGETQIVSTCPRINEFQQA